MTYRDERERKQAVERAIKVQRSALLGSRNRRSKEGEKSTECVRCR